MIKGVKALDMLIKRAAVLLLLLRCWVIAFITSFMAKLVE